MAAAPSTRSPHATPHTKPVALHPDGETDYDFGLTPLTLRGDTLQPDLLQQFERMLTRALKNTSDAITDRLTREIREVGHRTTLLEQRTEELELTAGNHSEDLEALREENSSLHSRLEDFENRARRSNVRIRGIPESVEDLQSTITALFQELDPSIPIERLEMDRIHRSLAPRSDDGPPRDIIVKLHFFRTKEQLMVAARNRDSLIFQGHRYQLFQDLSQATLAKRKAMKPHLLVLQHHKITYRWIFPFAVRFSYKGSSYQCKSPEDLHGTIRELHLTPPDHSPEGSRRRAASSSPQKTQAHQDRVSQHGIHKRGRYSSPAPAPAPEDTMD